MATRRSNRSPAQRRRMVWARTAHTQSGGATIGLDLLDEFRAANGGANLLGVTITRCRGTIQVEWSGAGAADQRMLAGFYVDSQSHGLAELMDPEVDRHADWMGYFALTRSYNGGGAATISTYEFDLKSQRRLDELNETLWLATTATGLVDAAIQVDCSTLVKLP